MGFNMEKSNGESKFQYGFVSVMCRNKFNVRENNEVYYNLNAQK